MLKKVILASVSSLPFFVANAQQNAAAPKLEVVAEWNKFEFDLGNAEKEKEYLDKKIYEQVAIQGVKLDSKGNIYLSSAASRWNSNETPASVNKMVKVNGVWKLQPFPNLQMNDPNNPKGIKASQGIEIDRNDVMWILDQGHVKGSESKPGDEKVIAWDLKTNKEIARYELKLEDSDKKCSFLNDLVVDNDNGFVYITDSGHNCKPLKGGLIVLNLKTKQTKKVLSAAEWVNDKPGYTFQINGEDIFKKTADGKDNSLKVGADGIALSGDKKTLYWTNLSDNRLLSLPTKVIQDFKKSEAEVIKNIQVVATLPSNTGGIISDRNNNLYLTGLSLNGVMRRDAKSGNVVEFVSDKEVSWPDGLAWGPDGYMYFMSNHLHEWAQGDMNFENPKTPNFRLYRFKVSGKPYNVK